MSNKRGEVYKSREWFRSLRSLNHNDKNDPLWRVFENLKLAVKQCYQTGQFYTDENWWKIWKMPKLKNSNATYWVIFKHCAAQYSWGSVTCFSKLIVQIFQASCCIFILTTLLKQILKTKQLNNNGFFYV